MYNLLYTVNIPWGIHCSSNLGYLCWSGSLLLSLQGVKWGLQGQEGSSIGNVEEHDHEEANAGLCMRGLVHVWRSQCSQTHKGRSSWCIAEASDPTPWREDHSTVHSHSGASGLLKHNNRNQVPSQTLLKARGVQLCCNVTVTGSPSCSFLKIANFCRKCLDDHKDK